MEFTSPPFFPFNTNGIRSTPCINLATAVSRYLIFPEENVGPARSLAFTPMLLSRGLAAFILFATLLIAWAPLIFL